MLSIATKDPRDRFPPFSRGFQSRRFHCTVAHHPVDCGSQFGMRHHASRPAQLRLFDGVPSCAELSRFRPGLVPQRTQTTSRPALPKFHPPLNVSIQRFIRFFGHQRPGRIPEGVPCSHPSRLPSFGTRPARCHHL